MRRSHVLVLAALLVLLTACAGQAGTGAPSPAASDPTASEPTATDPGGSQDPTALLGSWTLAGVAGEDGTEVQLEPSALSVKRSCGELSGSWRAGPSGLFIGYVFGSSGCAFTSDPNPAWLRRVASFRVEGAGPVLLDGQGGVVARLERKGAAPKVDDEARRAFGPAAALPSGLTPAGREALAGRWTPAGAGGRDRPYVEFHAEGGWTGSDGCNGQGGRWTAGADGALLAVSGASTLIACDGVPVGGWLERTRRAGLAGGALVLVDAEGKEIGRLQR
jgi:hypothetical protein